MADYVLLPHPGHGRLYLSGAFSAAAAELSALVPELTVSETALCGAPAYALFLPRALTETQLRALAASSLFYALFLREGALLLPVEPPEWRAMPDELNTIRQDQRALHPAAGPSGGGCGGASAACPHAAGSHVRTGDHPV